MTTHKPATPLPWVYEPNLERGDARTSGYIRERTITAEYANLGRAVAKAVRFNGSTDQERNAAYIAHAANAYPRLVEALEIALATVELYTGNGAQSQPANWPRNSNGDIDHEVVAKNGRALLRELGEL